MLVVLPAGTWDVTPCFLFCVEHILQLFPYDWCPFWPTWLNSMVPAAQGTVNKIEQLSFLLWRAQDFIFYTLAVINSSL